MIVDIVKIFIVTALSFFIGIIITPLLTHYLYKYKFWKKKAGKIGLDGKETPIFNELHKEKEVGTPRMGGVVIWASAFITIFGTWLIAQVFPNSLTAKLDFLSRNQTWIPLFTLMAGAVVGLFDDYFEVSGKGGYSSGGLSLKKRLIIVGLISLFSASWFYFKLDINTLGTPWGEIFIGWLVIPFFVALSLLLYSGGVIDGIDGLAGGVLAVAYSAYGIIAFYQQQINLASFCFAVAGGILAFLWFNIPPARFYMSETGSMALTITLAVIAFMTDSLGGGYAVIIQMLSKKFRNGKKIFLVAPLHHHFEAKGWPPYKVTMRYWIIAIVFAIIGVIIALLKRQL